MPVMNGIEATKLYRFASLGRPRTPIIALTADATPEMQARCREAGMDECLTKPIDPALLINVINHILAQGRGETPLAPAADETVTRLSEHPRFRPGQRAALDERTLKDLEALGGRDFVEDVLAQFIGDAGGVIDSLSAAAAAGDVMAFREQAHALRSSAANIGAKGIYEMCLAWREISPADLKRHGADHLARVAAEFDYVRQSIEMQPLRRREGSTDR
jgi:two-component system sensor histidine kinase RpfC